jgi:hypothetical protein
MGFDIRQSTGQSLFNLNIEDSNVVTAPATEKTVVFNFFGENDTSKAAETASKVEELVDPSRKRKVDQVAPVTAKPVEVEIELIEDDIIVLAKQFYREQ